MNLLSKKFTILHDYWIYSGKSICFMLKLLFEQFTIIITLWKYGKSFNFYNTVLKTPYGSFWVSNSHHVYVISSLYESHIQEVLINNYQTYKNNPNRIAINIGGHIGRYTMELANKYGYQVFAFEPNPETLHILKTNVVLSQAEEKVTVFPYALGNATETKQFFADAESAPSSCVINEWLNDIREKNGQILTIETKAFDDLYLIQNPKDVHLIIMDVEWYEKNVLFGMKNFLQQAVSIDIIIEIWENHPAKQEVIHFMESFGFMASPINQQDWLFSKK